MGKEDDIDLLVRGRFPRYRQARKDAELGRGEPQKQAQLILAEANAYRQHLTNLSDRELAPLLFAEHARRSALSEAAARERKEEQQAEEAARFWNSDGAEADLDYWAKLASWHMEEAIALSLGKRPQVVTWDKIRSVTRSPFVREYSRRREQVMRAIGMGEISFPVSPAKFLAWAERSEFELIEDLVDRVRARGQAPDWKTLYEAELRDRAAEFAALNAEIEALNQRLTTSSVGSEKSLSTRERETLLALVIGMAMDGYGYEPQASRSPIAKEIANALSRLGIGRDEDTVRKYLKEAAELLPPGDGTE